MIPILGENGKCSSMSQGHPFYLFYFYGYVFLFICMHVCVYSMCVGGTIGSRSLHPLELELLAVLSYSLWSWEQRLSPLDEKHLLYQLTLWLNSLFIFLLS